MRAAIDGLMFDTEKATEIGGWHSPHLPTDFAYHEETLYRTTAGRWFLHGEGGASSPYGRQVEANTFGSGSRIVPLTDGEAREWAETHLDADTVSEWFTLEEA